MSTVTPRFLSLDDLAHLPEPTWMIEGLFEKNSLVMLAGPSYSFKSFLALDWMLCMASGRSWLGRKTEPAKVCYMLGEGKSSMFKRIKAWATYNKLTLDERVTLTENFKVSFEITQLADSESLDKFLDDLKAEAFNPTVIVVDTFARASVGLDENEAKDTGLWIDSADKLRQLGYTVLFLHHTKKNTELGHQYRGSTAIMGAMDTAMTLVRTDNNCTLTVTKQKDHDEGKPMKFKKVMVNLGGDKESCVLEPIEVPPTVALGPEWIEEKSVPPAETDLINRLVADGSFESDRARARQLAAELGITEVAAQSRISRVKKTEAKS